MFLFVLGLQWLGAVLYAIFSSTSLSVTASFLIGGLLFVIPAIVIHRQPGVSSNQNVVATSQILFSTFLIYLTDGRPESHFHVFASLVLISFYRNWRPLVLASTLTLVDHLLRPEADVGRAFEHYAWVAFECVILMYSMRMSILEMWEIAKQQASLEGTLQTVETLAGQRTRQLEQERAFSIYSAKLASLGEIAGGIAHEINTPLGALMLYAQEVDSIATQNRMRDMKEPARHILLLVERISGVVQNLQRFVKSSQNPDEPKIVASVKTIIHDTLSLCQERFRSQAIEIRLDLAESDASLFCSPQEISQVLLNLLNNAYDASIAQPKQNRWIKIEFKNNRPRIELAIVDCGNGIPEAVQRQLMQPFFTTKDQGKGVGLSLSIAKKMVEEHGGTLNYDDTSPHTRFAISIPVHEEAKSHEYT